MFSPRIMVAPRLPTMEKRLLSDDADYAEGECQGTENCGREVRRGSCREPCKCILDDARKRILSTFRAEGDWHNNQ